MKSVLLTKFDLGFANPSSILTGTDARTELEPSPSSPGNGHDTNSSPCNPGEHGNTFIPFKTELLMISMCGDLLWFKFYVLLSQRLSQPDEASGSISGGCDAGRKDCLKVFHFCRMPFTYRFSIFTFFAKLVQVIDG